MNKGDLVDAVASQLGESRAAAARAVDAVLDAIGEGVKHDEKVTISGFGTFRTRERKARTGVNPATREPMTIAASTTINFAPAQALKDAVNHRDAAAV
jgi:DNA-binding protein HU-beta